MWQHHGDQLLRIITLRRQAHGPEPYDFIVWSVCCIDIYALLSVSGQATFVEVLLKQNMLPSPERCLSPVFQGQGPIIYPEEQRFFPALLKLHQEVLLLALRVGQEARDLRVESTQRQYGPKDIMIPESAFLINRRARTRNVHNLLEYSRLAWRTQFPDYWTWLRSPGSLPSRVFSWVNHVRVSFQNLASCTDNGSRTFYSEPA